MWARSRGAYIALDGLERRRRTGRALVAPWRAHNDATAAAAVSATAAAAAPAAAAAVADAFAAAAATVAAAAAIVAVEGGFALLGRP